MFYDEYDSPIGTLRIIGKNSGELVRICLTDSLWESYRSHYEKPALHPSLFQPLKKQLDEYFQGDRNSFSVQMNLTGTDFQKEVWNEVHAIPYGETKSYAAIAERIYRPKAVRAVGNANRLNPIPILVPCHRVIGKNRSMTGYAGGVQMKQALLKLEGLIFE
ncbi:methylated-DNA--[protein]-cysteine S-methyltransferase [Halobacillus sp. B23F22_1]|uniref:methylated-DNA--[protein]-cysteine S-methyltransferase n=1 Tax=Halobacillus sp. B23F22_1 TaxID=3459514 RepID=UPI00373F86D3